MKKAISILMAVYLLLSLCACSGGTTNTDAAESDNKENVQQSQTDDVENTDAEDYEVTDLMGRTVTIPGNTDAYACIGPGALRLYCYVADTAELVGVESVEQEWGDNGRPYNMAIPNVDELTVIGPGGPGNAPDAELLYDAAPDVIFSMYNSDTSSLDELQEKTGIPVVALSYGNSEVFDTAIYDSLSLIGQVTGHGDRAEEVINYMKDIETDLNTRTAEIENKPLVYLGCQSNKGSHGIESTVGNYALFEALNIRNAASEAGIPEYAMIDKEQILEMDPDVIIVDAGGYQILSDDYSANPDFYNSLSAVKNGKVYMQMPYNYYYTNLEIAIADAYYIGSVVYPEAFSDIVVEEKFDEISNFFLGIDSYQRIADIYFGGYQTVNLEK